MKSLKTIAIKINFILFLFISSTPLLSDSYSQEKSTFFSYPSALEKEIQAIYSYRPAKKLLEEISREGPISVAFTPLPRSEAMWDSFSRKILLTPKKIKKERSFITCIIFEMHNAKADKKLKHLTNLALHRKISKSGYIRSIEKVEHENALKTCALLNDGIQKNAFPKEAKWSVFKSFEEHFKIQQMSGHSKAIASNYDKMGERAPPKKAAQLF